MGYDAKISKVSQYGLIDLRAKPELVSRCASELNIEFPGEPNTSTTNGDVRVFWLGPEHWIVITDTSSDYSTANTLNKSFDGQHGIATVVSDQYTVFNLTGSDSRKILAQGCSIDLDPTVFRVGHCTACTFARTTAILYHASNDGCYEIIVESSLSNYLGDWLSNAIGTS